MIPRYFLSTKGVVSVEHAGDDTGLTEIDIVGRLNAYEATIAAQARVIEALETLRSLPKPSPSWSFSENDKRQRLINKQIKLIRELKESDPTPAACPDCERMREERDKDRRAFTKLFLKTEKEMEREKMLRIGGLYLLAADGIISTGRACELADCTHEEMRAEARSALAQSEEQATNKPESNSSSLVVRDVSALYEAWEDGHESASREADGASYEPNPYVKPSAQSEETKPVQQQVGEWHLAKFGPVDPSKPLLVAVGELGELAQSHVKAEQGHLKRYQGTDYDAKARDAVGDTQIALRAYCYRRGWDYDQICAEVWDEVSQRFKGESAQSEEQAGSGACQYCGDPMWDWTFKCARCRVPTCRECQEITGNCRECEDDFHEDEYKDEDPCNNPDCSQCNPSEEQAEGGDS